MDIKENTSLKPYNTFGVTAKAKKLIQIRNENELVLLFNQGIFSEKFFVLGGGSNVLFTQNFEGTIIRISNKGIQHFI
ncbi:MAG TPA: UDP-N-acetylenolpyruvoylglucosamine reductase, partial [Sphingobacterium sp.]|nr:UDP-N-acetylenolpyruvoylglucosamine reductase [Sphingobacterium sp.]